MNTVRLIDEQLIEKCVFNSKGIITHKEWNISWGMGLAVIEAFERLYKLPSKIKTLGINDSFVSVVAAQEFFFAILLTLLKKLLSI